MVGKPFSIQAPETIAKEYGGNKQKIAQAVQSGLLDPTAGVLAGMFIDRMRSAQTQEQAQAPSVAQQVLAPPAPMVPQAGLGAMPPQVAPPMAMAEGGFLPPYASGGLDDLPVPDTMFDEPSNGGFNDGYAGGGMVAFARAGSVKSIEELRRTIADPNSSVEEYNDAVRELSRIEREQHVQGLIPKAVGAVGSFFGAIPGVIGKGMQLAGEGEAANALNQRNMTRILGGYNTATDPLEDPASLLAARAPIAPPARAPAPNAPAIATPPPAVGLPPVPPTAATSPGVRTRPPAAPTAAAGLAAIAPQGAPQPAAQGDLASQYGGLFEQGMDVFKKYMPDNHEARDLMAAEARKTLDPTEQKRQKDEDKWMTLAQIGFNMAASNSPYFLQAVGAAAAAALPGAKEDKKAREAAKRQAINDLAQVEGLEYKEAAEKVKYGQDFANTQLGIKDKDLSRQVEIMLSREKEAGADRRAEISAGATLGAARIAADSYARSADRDEAKVIAQARINAPRMALADIQSNPRAVTMKPEDRQALLKKLTQQYFDQMTTGLNVGGGGIGSSQDPLGLR